MIGIGLITGVGNGEIMPEADEDVFCKHCGMIIVERKFPDEFCGYRIVWVHVHNSNVYCHPSTIAEPQRWLA